MYKITAEPGYLRAELFERETVEETRAFLDAVVRSNVNHRRSRILILVRLSKSIFQVVAHGLMECFEELSTATPGQIALVGDTRDLNLSHEYIEVIARQRGLNVRSFRDEATALAWLNDRRLPHDRRQHPERRQQERRASLEGRQSAR
jgi:hypothetical protein